MRVLIVAYLTGGGAPHFYEEILRSEGHQAELFGMDTDLPIALGQLHDMHEGNYAFRSPAEKFLVNRLLLHRVKRFKPEALVIMGSNWLITSETLKKIKNSGCLLVLREGNLEFFYPDKVAALSLYDAIYTSDSYAIPILSQVMGLNRVYYAHNGAPVGFYNPPKYREGEYERFKAEVSFIGAAFPERASFFKELSQLGVDFTLWGVGWENYPELKGHHVPKRVRIAHKARIYGATKINLDFRAGHQQLNGFSSRVFESLCCGAFALTEYRIDFERHFKLGEELDTFKDAEEAACKIDYYLKNPDIRAGILERGRARIKKDWSMRKICAEMIEQLKTLS